jgi:hypothetical protein
MSSAGQGGPGRGFSELTSCLLMPGAACVVEPALKRAFHIRPSDQATDARALAGQSDSVLAEGRGASHRRGLPACAFRVRPEGRGDLAYSAGGQLAALRDGDVPVCDSGRAISSSMSPPHGTRVLARGRGSSSATCWRTCMGGQDRRRRRPAGAQAGSSKPALVNSANVADHRFGARRAWRRRA